MTPAIFNSQFRAPPETSPRPELRDKDGLRTSLESGSDKRQDFGPARTTRATRRRRCSRRADDALMDELNRRRRPTPRVGCVPRTNSLWLPLKLAGDDEFLLIAAGQIPSRDRQTRAVARRILRPATAAAFCRLLDEESRRD